MPKCVTLRLSTVVNTEEDQHIFIGAYLVFFERFGLVIF